MAEVERNKIERCPIPNCCGKTQIIEVDKILKSQRTLNIQFLTPQEQGLSQEKFGRRGGTGRPEESFPRFGMRWSIRRLVSDGANWVTRIPINQKLLEFYNSPRFLRATADSRTQVERAVYDTPEITTPLNPNCPFLR